MTTGYPIFNILGHFRGVNWHEVSTEQVPYTIPKADDLIFTAVPLKSEAPPIHLIGITLSLETMLGIRWKIQNRYEFILCSRIRGY